MLLRIGSCRIDTDRRQILRDGAEHHLPRKRFELLVALIEARPKVVTKDDLMARVWPDAFVSDSNLAVLVGDIRVAIGDSARKPRFIKTHHGVGYSFIGDVLEISPSPRAKPDGPIAVLTVGKRRIELPDGTVTVGRDDSSDIALPHRSVSRLHARLTVSGVTLVVDDADSKNGTRVDGARIKAPTPVGEGQELRFGSVIASVTFERGSTSSTLTVRDDS